MEKIIEGSKDIRANSIGPLELNTRDFDKLKSQVKGVTDVIYWYEYESYSGDGYLISWDGENFGYFTLGHCSCFGPLENGYSGKFNKEEILKLIDKLRIYDYHQEDEGEKTTQEIKEAFIKFVNTKLTGL